MIQRILIGKHRVSIFSEQYAAILRVRYRRLLVRRGIPAQVVLKFKTLSELREIARLMLKGR